MSDPRGDWSVVFQDEQVPPDALGQRAVYADGTWVVMANRGSYVTDFSDMVIFSSSSVDGPWETNAVSLPTDNHVMAAIGYGDGKWVAVGGSGYPTYQVVIFTATDPQGTWTQRTSLEDTDTGYPGGTDIAYADGKWVLGTYGGRIYTATDPTSTWTLRFDPDTTETVANVYYRRPEGGRMAYLNGNWVSVYWLNPGIIEGYTYGTHVWSPGSDPTDTWTKRAFFEDGNYGWYYPQLYGKWASGDLLYENGLYIVNTGSQVWACATLGGDWTMRYDWSDLATYYGAEAMTLGFADGDWVAAEAQTDYGPYVTSDLEGPWELAELDPPPAANGVTYENYSMSGVFGYDEDWVGWGRHYSAVGEETDSRAVLYSPAGGGEGWGLLL